MDFQEIVRDIDRQVRELQKARKALRKLGGGSATDFVPDEEGCRLLAVLPFLAPRRHAGRN